MELVQNGTHVRIEPDVGGRVASFMIDGLELLVERDGLPTLWGCYPMAPWAGRVRNGQFSWDGETIELPLRLPPHALHGTVLDCPWSVSGPSKISTDLGPEWPWNAELESQFSLAKDSFTWLMTARNDGQRMPISMGWHPWFRKSLEGGPSAEFSFSADTMLERGGDGLPTGRRIPPSRGPWDDCFTDLSAPIRIRYSHGLRLELTSSCRYWMVYDTPDHAFCLEPQSAPPDAFNIGGAEILEAGQALQHWMTWRWWYDDQAATATQRGE